MRPRSNSAAGSICPARGWHSGDAHIHYARAGGDADRRLLAWARAEDLRVANILRMGDGRRTYFEQYAFGKPGRVLDGRIALVPGQEDPRSSILGHTIGLNLRAPIRDPQRYYVYGEVFAEMRRQGGLAGYAHVIDDGFLVHRDMTINVPRGLVDFAEICEDGAVGTDLYYEFLDLGFRLTAAGGSDPPWGGTVGESRTYAYTGRAFDVDEWFQAVRNGRTFVTAGPMLEFRVDGNLPGARISSGRGRKLRIHASALTGSAAMPLGRLEIVANGEVIRGAEPAGNSAALDFELPAERSMWLAARTAGSHTTPVYVTVDGRRHWNVARVPALIAKRLRTLMEVETLLGQSERVAAMRGPENVEAFQRGSDDLRRAIREAREAYQCAERRVPGGSRFAAFG